MTVAETAFDKLLRLLRPQIFTRNKLFQVFFLPPPDKNVPRLLYISFGNERSNVTLSIVCSRVTIKDKDVKILAVNNISDDIEVNKVEAWTWLIRVLTHEIMNSISPIALLSETLPKFYGNDNAELKEGLDVINKTSRGLIDFVESYRSITRINKPMRKAIPFHQLINNILTLKKEEFSANDISVEVTANRNDIMLYVDEGQISQVIINVIKNAVQAGANKIGNQSFHRQKTKSSGLSSPTTAHRFQSRCRSRSSCLSTPRSRRATASG